MKTYTLDLREQTTAQIFPQLIKNMNHYFSDYTIYKEDGIYTIHFYDFNSDRFVMRMRFLYTERENKNYIFLDYSLNVILDYNEFCYNEAEILQLIYKLFNSINIYGIIGGLKW